MSVVIVLKDDSREIEKLRALNESATSISKQDLPKPSFRLIGDADFKRKPRVTKQEFHRGSYYRYIEPSTEDLTKRVEYDMDEEDEEWLAEVNEKLADRFSGYKLAEAEFERIMDCLEKASYFESKSEGREVVPKVDEDAVCAICLNGDSYVDTNKILFCDMCDLPVHQECYGVPYVPEGQWLCRRCLQSPSSGVDCRLCPNKGGAFKQTEGGEWAHVICALWIPEVCFANTVFLEPIDNIDQIPTARWKLTCYICKQKNVGACIQCRKKHCYVPFHVTCAQQAGLYMRIRTHRYESASGPYLDVMKEAYCDSHAPKDKSKRQGMYSDADDETELEEVNYECKNYQKQGKKRDSMSKTRKILAEKRASDPNPISEPAIKREKIEEISKDIPIPRGGRFSLLDQKNLRDEIIRRIEGYWIQKRKKRKGVPLLRRLQVSLGVTVEAPKKLNFDVKKYEDIKYKLERARLLVGMVKRRELIKKRIHKKTELIVAKKLQLIDRETPATEP